MAFVLAALLPIFATEARAYDASIAWQPVAGASGYRIQVRYGADGTPQSTEIGMPAADPDGLLRVVLTALPLVPVTYFTATAYDASGRDGAASASLSIRYAAAAAVSDSDGDGLTDAEEDSDLDGVRDAGETSAHDPDSDNDGVSDGSEVRLHGSDPLSADSDGDGWSDAEEIGGGSDPLDSASAPTGCVDGCSTPVACSSSCDDRNPCTLDACELGDCIHLPATRTCDDGLACSSFDMCDDSVCRGTNACGNAETCDAVTGECRADDAVWIAAARDDTALRRGTMTSGATYARGTDADPSADSLAAELVFSSSAASTLTAGSGDEVRYTITLPHDGDWYLWGRMYYPGTPGTNDANSFFARVDGGTAKTFGNNKDYFRRWHYGGNGAVDTGEPTPLALGRLVAGQHTLTIEKREVVPIAPRLDVLVLTRDPLAHPTDEAARAALGDKLSGSASTSTTTTTTTLPPPPLPPASSTTSTTTSTTTTSTTTTTLAPQCKASSDCGVAPACSSLACVSGKCVRSSLTSGSCNDGDPCTVGDACAAGACAGWPLDCSHLDSACTYGMCDGSRSECVAVPLASGTACNDGSACTIGDACDDGLCVGERSCDDGSFCDERAAVCKVRQTVWLSAAADASARFGGSMRADTLYAGGTDSDPKADSLERLLVYAASSVSALKGGSPDLVTYDVTLPETGVWYLWARVYYPGAPGSNDANSFFARIDAGTRLRLGNNKDYFRRWHWGGDGSVEHGALAPLKVGRLVAGLHRLTIEKREVLPAAPRVDVLVLTQDPSWVPTDVEAGVSLRAGFDVGTTTTTLQ